MLNKLWAYLEEKNPTKQQDMDYKASLRIRFHFIFCAKFTNN